MKNLASVLFSITVLAAVVLIYGRTDTMAKMKLASHESGQIVVKFKELSGLYTFKFESNSDLRSVLTAYNNNPLVEYAELNYIFQTTNFPNDPEYGKQNYIQLISAREAWSKELLYKQLKGLKGDATIAFLDTGIDTDHPDLQSKLWINENEIPNNGIDDDGNGYIDDYNGWNFVSKNSNINPDTTGAYSLDALQHGTVMASIAAAESNNNEGVTGISWDAKVMSLKVLNNQGLGSSLDVKSAIDYAVANGADVINMSFFGLGYNQFLYDAIQSAYNAGVVIVAAAGNTDSPENGNNLNVQKSYPVCYDNPNGTNYVIGVAALDNLGRKSVFSSYGSDCVDISAPGEGFYAATMYNPQVGLTTFYGGPFAGTSVASPVIAGGAAVVRSMRPDLSNGEVIDIIIKAADDLSAVDTEFAQDLGSGRFNLLKAVNRAETFAGKTPAKEISNVYVVVGLGFQSVPQVKVLDANKKLVSSFFPYDLNFNGAINVATGDVNGDGAAEIITAPGPGGGPHVRIYDRFGNSIGQFFAYNQFFRGGVNIAVGDVDNDGQLEIITGAGPGGGPHVRIFDYRGNLENEFFAYAPGFRGGVNVASGDLDGDGTDEIITGAGPGGGPHVRVFNRLGGVKAQFFAYHASFEGGVNVEVGNLANPTVSLITVAPATVAQPIVKMFNGNGNFISQYLVFDGRSEHGLQVSVFDYNNDGLDEVVVSQARGPADIEVYDFVGKKLDSFNPHDVGRYFGGVRTDLLIY
ncbi:MAG: hypothetical protein COT81_01825 [Candidatus Buchananbacteria bacterium CG10_big_fil_rev_8_21_14_0_10_42_9]|uniref:Peptidase S8/S53 domain-containing protein n=1 Tax=Candidatus Buchananbacteria bacterium CG10_big_fil_rev_8_21_14_0_10_42_9 TaxID=1974526 RepID=A0A2H0W1Q0_9BACT|nr:MAG: hypothetical protein COT81_01825 [Candidatus Buchananbacteria bacterium CG10_big_fil_rev_8_21_14_0_10_42_9]